MKITEPQIDRFIQIRKEKYGEVFGSREEARNELEGITRIMNWLIKNGASVVSNNSAEQRLSASPLDKQTG